MLRPPVTIDLEGLPWKSHPTIAGIQVKLVANEAGFSPVDVLVAQVAAHGEIPWHIHPAHSEIAYVLQGEGVLYYAEDEAHEDAARSPMTAGSASLIPPGLWHSVKNVGDTEMLIFAAHTP